MDFGMIKENQNMVKMQNFVTWIQTASSFMSKQMIFTKMLQKMLKQDLTLQILKESDDYLKEKISDWTNER